MGFSLRSNRLLGHMSHMELFGWLFGWHAYCYKCPASPLMLCVPAWLCPFRYNKGYALLLYDNSDISAYMKQFYPGFMPSEQDQHMHGGWSWSYSATEPIGSSWLGWWRWLGRGLALTCMEHTSHCVAFLDGRCQQRVGPDQQPALWSHHVQQSVIQPCRVLSPPT